MPVTKKVPAKKAAAKKEPATKAAKQPLLLGPTYQDPKIDQLVRRFEATLKAMSAQAVKTVKAFHANKLESDAKSADVYEALHAIYPPLCLAQYAELHWALMKALMQHHVSPTKRNENAVVARREKLLDHLDYWEVEPLRRAWLSRDKSSVGGKELRAYEAAKHEQRRIRLGLTPDEFAQLRKKEKAEYAAHSAALDGKYAAAKAELKAKEKAKKAGKALA